MREKLSFLFGTGRLGFFDKGDVQTLIEIGQKLCSHDKYKQALAYFKKALAVSQKIHGEEHQDVSMALKNIGMALDGMGQFREAILYYDRSSAINRKIAEKESMAHMETQL